LSILRAFLISAILAKAIYCAPGGCPVRIDHVNRDTGLRDVETFRFTVKATDISGRKIAVAQFKAAAVDANRMVHTLQFVYPIETFEPGQTKKAEFDTHRLVNSNYRGIKVWVAAVRFADGTNWSDSDDSRSCGNQDLKK
jgi:hypothetical protein